MVKGALTTTGGMGSSLGWGTKSPHVSQPKNQNINNRNSIVTQSIKILKMVHIKKKILKSKKIRQGRHNILTSSLYF